ncbi:hypothetical protein ACH5RR_030829 [Cinchona calisaya]|uniref:Uncharacterized protein n=1 Tax=Cinchona calisaya TaxID=153742 RepID=A0ABD2Z0V7_9GENT
MHFPALLEHRTGRRIKPAAESGDDQPARSSKAKAVRPRSQRGKDESLIRVINLNGKALIGFGIMASLDSTVFGCWFDVDWYYEWKIFHVAYLPGFRRAQDIWMDRTQWTGLWTSNLVDQEMTLKTSFLKLKERGSSYGGDWAVRIEVENDE